MNRNGDICMKLQVVPDTWTV